MIIMHNTESAHGSLEHIIYYMHNILMYVKPLLLDALLNINCNYRKPYACLHTS